jgi:hypothetical protein
MRGCTFFDHRESHKVFTFTSKKPIRLCQLPRMQPCRGMQGHAGACTEDRLEAVAEARLQHDSGSSTIRADLQLARSAWRGAPVQVHHLGMVVQHLLEDEIL